MKKFISSVAISSVYRKPDLIRPSCLEYEQMEKMSTQIFVLFLAVLCTGIKASFFDCTSMQPLDEGADCNDASAAPINFVVLNSDGEPVSTVSAGEKLTS